MESPDEESLTQLNFLGSPIQTASEAVEDQHSSEKSFPLDGSSNYGGDDTMIDCRFCGIRKALQFSFDCRGYKFCDKTHARDYALSLLLKEVLAGIVLTRARELHSHSVQRPPHPILPNLLYYILIRWFLSGNGSIGGQFSFELILAIQYLAKQDTFFGREFDVLVHEVNQLDRIVSIFGERPMEPTSFYTLYIKENRPPFVCHPMKFTVSQSRITPVVVQLLNA
jgi:hypothetical protein